MDPQPNVSLVGGIVAAAQNKTEMLQRALATLVKPYSDPTHFLYELLQNAEDAEATRIRFTLYADRLEVVHDGAPFTKDDLQRLCDVGMSEKWAEDNKIGQFGIGFKSVFMICDEVILTSEPGNATSAPNENQPRFAVRIHDFVDLEDVDFVPIPRDTTRFVFRFSAGHSHSGFSDIVKLRGHLTTRLRTIDASTLLFLHHLQSVEYRIEVDMFGKALQTPVEGVHCLSKEVLAFERRCEGDQLWLVSSLGETNWQAECSPGESLAPSTPKQERATSFVVFSRPCKNLPSKTIDIAFPVIVGEDGTWEFCAAQGQQRYAFLYFPTDTPSNLNFIVQAPWRTPPTRANISQGNEENRSLAQQLAALFHDSVLTLRDQNRFPLSLLCLLPFSSEGVGGASDLFQFIHETTLRLLREEAILPCHEGGFTDAAHAKLARRRDLVDLFPNALLSELVADGKEYAWLDTRITETNARYLSLNRVLKSEAKVEELRLEDVARKVNDNPDFLPNQSEEWLLRFYEQLETIPEAFEKTKSGNNLLSVRLLKTQTGAFHSAVKLLWHQDPNEPKRYDWQVFLPPATALLGENILFVAPDLYAKRPRFFMEIVKLKRPDAYANLAGRLAKHYQTPETAQEVPLEQHLEDIRAILHYLTDPDHMYLLRALLAQCVYVRCRQGETVTYVNPRQERQTTCVPFTEDGRSLAGYLARIEEANIIDWDAYHDAGFTFDELKKLGVRTDLVEGLDETEGICVPHGRGNPPRWYVPSGVLFRPALSLFGLDAAIDAIRRDRDVEDAKDKSIFILRTLFLHANRLRGEAYLRKDQSVYETKAAIIRTLQATGVHWLLTQSGEWVSPKGMRREALADCYGERPLESCVYELLGFRQSESEQWRQLEEDYLRHVPEEKRMQYLSVALRHRFNLSLKELDDIVQRDAEARRFTFPEKGVTNWSALARHVRQVYADAPNVTYEQVLRSVRRNALPPILASAYVRGAYQLPGGQFACQMCHTKTRQIEVCQLEPRGGVRKDLTQHRLCLCPSCAGHYRMLREDEDLYDAFIRRIRALTQEEIDAGSPVKVAIGERELWFTQTHIAEMVELLRLMKN